MYIETPNYRDIKRSIKIKLGKLDRCEVILSPEQNKNLTHEDVNQLRSYYRRNNFLIDFEHTFINNSVGYKIILSRLNHIDCGLVGRETNIY